MTAGIISAFIVGGLLGFLLSRNTVDENEEESDGKRINELTDGELKSIRAEVEREWKRRKKEKENYPFRC